MIRTRNWCSARRRAPATHAAIEHWSWLSDMTMTAPPTWSSFTDGASGPWPPIYKSEEFDQIAPIAALVSRDAAPQGRFGAHEVDEELKGAQWGDRRLRVEHADWLNLAISSAEGVGIAGRCAEAVATFRMLAEGRCPADPGATLRRRSERGIQHTAHRPCTKPADSVYCIQQAVTLGLGFAAQVRGLVRTARPRAWSGSRRARPSMPTRERAHAFYGTRWAISAGASSLILPCSPRTCSQCP